MQMARVDVSSLGLGNSSPEIRTSDWIAQTSKQIMMAEGMHGQLEVGERGCR
jgi:hypothetical protein